jgi:biotin carboxyl carrier protein
MKLIVNGDKTYELENGRLNGEAADLDIQATGDGTYHVLRDGNGYTAEWISSDPGAKTMSWRINGNEYVVQIRDHFDELLESLGMADLAATRVDDIKAPMPGLVLQIMVEAGQQVAKGEPVLILEAMKMENVLKAPADVTVQGVEVAKGDAVEKNQVLVRLV